MQQTSRKGIFRSAWVFLFGEEDRIDKQLRKIARQGELPARFSHVIAFTLIVLFSFATLITLGADNMGRVSRSFARHAPDYPAIISLAVLVFFVVCMDWASLRASGKLRIKAAHHAPAREFIGHAILIVAIGLVEGGSFALMAALYDKPTGFLAGVLWLFIACRSILAPIVSIYLSMDRAHAVETRDMLALVQLEAGRAMLQQIATHTAMSADDIARIGAVYAAATLADERDSARLDNVVAVLRSVAHDPDATGARYDSPPELPPPGDNAPASGKRSLLARPSRYDNNTDDTNAEYSSDVSASAGARYDSAGNVIASDSTAAQRSRAAKRGRVSRTKTALFLLADAERDRAYALLDDAHANQRALSIKGLAGALNVSEGRARSLKQGWTRRHASAPFSMPSLDDNEAGAL